MKTKRRTKRVDTRIREAAPRGVRAAKPVKPASKPLSPVAAMRAVLAKDPGASVEQIEAALAKQGMSKSRVTIATIKSDFTGTYKALAAAGALKAPVAVS